MTKPNLEVSNPVPVLGFNVASITYGFNLPAATTLLTVMATISGGIFDYTGVTHNGKVVLGVDAEGTSALAYLWRRVSPDIGNFNIIVPLFGGIGSCTSQAAGWSSVNTASPFDGIGSFDQTNFNPTVVLTTTTNQVVIDVCSSFNVGSAPVKDASQTSLYTGFEPSGTNGGASSYKNGGAGSTTMTYSNVGTSPCLMAVAINGTTGSGGVGGSLLLRGVGS